MCQYRFFNGTNNATNAETETKTVLLPLVTGTNFQSSY